ncbi:putative LPS assembly protein LptD [Halocola ammonii]
MLIIGFLPAFSQADSLSTQAQTDSLTAAPDTVGVNADSTAIISENDSLPSRDVVNSKVDFQSSDSASFDLENNVYKMYRNAVVKYEDLELTAGYIEYNFKTNTVCAEGILDTADQLVQTPVFLEGGKEYNPKSMCYNFRTGKAFIKETVTKQGEMYLHAESTKRQKQGWFSIKDGKVTTCDAENPHYHFQLTKGIVIPGDKIVSGPVYMKVRKVPTPLALPFGFFPRKNESSHGILLPAYGDGGDLGFFLQNLGYYIPIKDWADTKLLGDIYSRGSWSLRNVTNYRKRYKFNGSFEVSRTVRKNGIPELPDFNKETTFFVRWNHQQDPKAHPKSNFSADVNLGSTNNFRNNLNSSQEDFLTNTFQSNIRYSRSGSYKGVPLNLSVNARQSQNSNTGRMSLNLPTVAFTASRFFPLEGLDKPGASEFVEGLSRIGVRYSADFDNRLSVDQSEVSLDNLGKLTGQFRNGIQHQAQANTSLKAGYFTFNPSVNYNEYWYFKSLELGVDPETMTQQIDTVPGFIAGRDWSASVSATTKIFTTIQYRSEVVKALRHVLTPNLSFSYNPNRDTREYAYIGEEGEFTSFSPFDYGIYGTPSTTRNGNVNFSLQNNLEMKVRDRKSEKGTKKLKLIENFTIRSGYNVFADSLNLSPVSMNGFTTLFENISLNYNSRYSPYARDSLGRTIDRFLVNEPGSQALRLQNASVGLSANLRSKTQSNIGSTRNNNFNSNVPPSVRAQEQEGGEELNEEEPSEKQKWYHMPWSLNVTYNLVADRQFDPVIQSDTTDISQAIMFNGNVTILDRWKLSVNSGYDFDTKDFTTTSLQLYWDLHCWELTFSYIPFGVRQSYNVQLNVKASVLQDLKLQRRQNLSTQDDGLLY